MRFVVEDLPEDGARFAGTAAVNLGAYQEADEVAVGAPVSYDLTVTRFGSTVTVAGWLRAVASVACGRCARPFDIPVAREFDAVYVTADVGEADGAELDEDDLNLDYYQDGVIDAIRLLAEQIFLALPMKILCSEDCKGLCAQCGVDLNAETCDCEAPVDVRLASLKGLAHRP